MANIVDYLAWRGDLSFQAAPFNEVDNLILSELAYLDFSGLTQGERLPLKRVAHLYFQNGREEEMENSAMFQAPRLPPLLEACAESERFGNILVSHPSRHLDLAEETQFAAVTFDLGPAGVFVAYSGTDDTLVGWKEDFNMSFMEAVPAHRQAMAYFEWVAADYAGRPLMLGGHSKGGNLSVYTALNTSELLQSRIRRVYSNDGPGFRDDVVNTPRYRRMKPRILTLVPQSSIIGMLLEHDEDYQVVRSSQKGFFQHDGFSWEVERAGFVRVQDRPARLEMNDRTVKSMLNAMNIQQREQFVDAVYSILTSGGTRTTTELRDEGILKNLPAMKKTYDSLDEDTREAVGNTLRLLISERIRVRFEFFFEEPQVSQKLEHLAGLWEKLTAIARDYSDGQE